MKGPSVFVLALVCAFQLGSALECAELCAAVRGDDLVQREVDRACNKFRYELPRPRVWSACRTGFTQTQQVVCSEVCESEKEFSNYQLVRQNCQGLKNQAPKPLLFNSCVAGANAAAKTMNRLTLEALQNGGVDTTRTQPKEAPAKVVKEEPIEYANPEPVHVERTAPRQENLADEDESEIAMRLLEEQLHSLEE